MEIEKIIENLPKNQIIIDNAIKAYHLINNNKYNNKKNNIPVNNIPQFDTLPYLLK